MQQHRQLLQPETARQQGLNICASNAQVTQGIQGEPDSLGIKNVSAAQCGAMPSNGLYPRSYLADTKGLADLPSPVTHMTMGRRTFVKKNVT